MNKTNENGRGPRNVPGVLVVILAVFFVFFLGACDDTIAAEEDTESTARSITEINSGRVSRRSWTGEGRTFSQEDFARWAEARGISPEDFTRRFEGRTFSQEDRERWAEARRLSREEFSRRLEERGLSREDFSRRRDQEQPRRRFNRDNEGEGRGERRQRSRS